MAINLQFEITLSSDFHIGAGYGDGVVDTLLLRDADGSPVIRGTTITGLLRDSLYQLLNRSILKFRPSVKTVQSAKPVEENTQLPLHCDLCGYTGTCPICRIFGTPSAPKPWRISNAHAVVQEIRDCLKASTSTRESYTVQRARISPRSRRAEPRKLFSQELGEQAWTFRFTAENTASAEQDLANAALLIAAARAVRGLGQARKRGQGDCRIHLVDRDLETQWMTAFKTYWLEREKAVWPTIDGQDVDTRALPELTLQGVGKPRRFYIIARSVEPIVLSRRSEAANEFESSQVIPGNVVMGVLAGRAATAYDLEQADERKVFTQLFRRGRIRFSHLLPAEFHTTETLIPTIPAPLDMLTCKAFPGFRGEENAHSVSAFSLSETPPEHCLECEEKFPMEAPVPLKPLKDFVTLSETPQQYRPRRRHEMHIAVDPHTGRVKEGDLYGYVSLEAGQYFLGEIVCSDDAAWEALKTISTLPDFDEAFPVYVGRASRRGHGKMLWAIQEPEPDQDYVLWRGAALAERVPSRTTKITMTLLTDTIVPDMGTGQKRGFSLPWLKSLLGPNIEIVRAFARTCSVDGFWGHLGLPRFRDNALVAGSTVGIRFKDSSEDLLETLAELEATGVGLRCHEGFGQVVFNHPLYEKRLWARLDACRIEDIPKSLLALDNRSKVAQEADQFVGKWWKELDSDDLRNIWQVEAYADIARLIHQYASGSLQALEIALSDEAFGKSEVLLGETLVGPRNEKKHVKATQTGRRKIIALLHALESLVNAYVQEDSACSPEQLWRLGIEMLADRVGRDAEQARKQSQLETPAHTDAGAEEGEDE